MSGEVKKGYKMTEVGVVPEEWGVAPFVSLGSVIDGDRGIKYPGSKDFSSDGHCLFLNAGNVTKSGFRFNECVFITREKDDLLSKGKLKRDDIVLTTRGTVGNFAHFNLMVPFEHIRINSGMVILRKDSILLDTPFLYELLQSYVVEQQIERLTFGSAQPQLTVKGISKFAIVVPPLPEQRLIAAALSDVDALITALGRLIAKKRDIKQAAMQELLTGKKRLPGFKGEWEEKRLGDECDLITKGTTPTSIGRDFQPSGIVFVKVESLDDKGNIWADKVAYIDSLTNNLLKRSQLQENDVLISIAGALGRTAVVKRAILPANTNQALSIVRLKSQANIVLEYLLHALKTDKIRLHIESISVQGAQANLSLENISDLPILMPNNKSEQTAIASILSDLDAELSSLENRLAKTRALKQGMMQELLTGRTRLV